jgi:hypothetical protein
VGDGAHPLFFACSADFAGKLLTQGAGLKACATHELKVASGGMTSARRPQAGGRMMTPNTTRAAVVCGCGVRHAGRRRGSEARQDGTAKLSGTWVLNRELSTGFGAPGRGRGGRRSSERPRARCSRRARPRPLSRAGRYAVPQRGGGGGGAGDPTDLTPEQRAEQAAMRRFSRSTRASRSRRPRTA